MESFLQELAELACGVVDPPASCGITLSRDGEPLTVVSSDDRAEFLDERQYESSEGPCLQAMRTGQPVYVRDVSTELRWSHYITAARNENLGSSYSMPLTVHGVTIGAMNMYAFHTAAAFDPAQQQACSVFAAQAAGALQLATQNARNSQLLEQLEGALASRTVIDQALGILMAQHSCSASEAFQVLRTQSQNSQRKLRDIAARLIEETSGQAPSHGKLFDK